MNKSYPNRFTHTYKNKKKIICIQENSKTFIIYIQKFYIYLRMYIRRYKLKKKIYTHGSCS